MRFLSLLGMAQAAGKLVSGDRAVYDALARGRVRLLVIAGDAAARTGKRFMAQAASKNIPYLITESKAALGQAIGKPDRAVIGVLDAQFARSLQAALSAGIPPSAGNGATRRA
jgi:ribosomal protein L7Ae-like RNA K-turn-binding protein